MLPVKPCAHLTTLSSLFTRVFLGPAPRCTQAPARLFFGSFRPQSIRGPARPTFFLISPARAWSCSSSTNPAAAAPPAPRSSPCPQPTLQRLYNPVGPHALTLSPPYHLHSRRPVSTMAYPTPSPDVLEAASDLSTPFPAIPAAEHRAQVREALAKAGIETGVVYLRGDVTAERHHTDVEVMFRQESNFLYVTGCEEPGYHYLLDVASGESFLFAPVVELDEAVWIGMPPSLEDQTETYGLPVLGGVPALQDKLAELDPAAVYVLDIESNYEALGEEFASRVAKEVATEALTNARLRKTEGEAALIRRANAISHRAHVAVMRAAALATSETALEALFRYTCKKHGAKQQGLPSRSSAPGPTPRRCTTAATWRRSRPLRPRRMRWSWSMPGAKCVGTRPTLRARSRRRAPSPTRRGTFTRRFSTRRPR
ncbi:hypothetical protein AMAG_13862 [Allomyces macrogynus ATCC 38327]|uniref:Aminopeptidase P N-terminal domain-containing protein n=1 Tax=Allomyces macrogynus (strain ATCC 38327) TaxID=578462 RepID=A0A0L0T2D8_ALLM3|nr:hypothetical protein AMAG_13862 [Allomyces macrogynus ATCC 38327]|eukprot:KNE68988.1 hypothetical protein AMAG_13862 [Allomyces macrogynus ATCC 38327]